MIHQFYTDGGCFPNPGVGAWAYIKIVDDCVVHRASGIEQQSTNNRMEIRAVIEVMRSLKEPSKIHIVTDSKFVISICEDWAKSWESRGWKKASKKDPVIKNLELVKELWSLYNFHEVKLDWVKGHSGDEFNEICDELCAERMAENYGISLSEMRSRESIFTRSYK